MRIALRAVPVGAAIRHAAGTAVRVVPPEAATAVRLGLTVVAAVYLAMRFELQRPEWAAWTVLSVSLATRAGSLHKAAWRAFGTVIGAVAAILLVSAFAQDTLAFDIALAVWLGLATAGAGLVRGQRSYGFSLIGFTVPIITLTNVSEPLTVFPTAVDRCFELLLGIACANISATLVAPGTAAVRARLAAGLAAASDACAAWVRSGRAGEGWENPPVRAVLALDAAVVEAFVEQPALRIGGGAAAAAPGALLAVLASGMLEAHLPGLDSEQADRLLAWRVHGLGWRVRRAQVAARVLGRGGRIGRRPAPAQPLALDRDVRQAFNNAVRAALAISLVNAFWYWSEWPSGGAAVSWAAITAALLAARDNAAKAAWDFLVGAALAVIVGLAVHYTVLTSTGSFGLLASVLLPVGMLGGVGRSDSRAVATSGFGIAVFSIIEPTNAMEYDLSASLNNAVATLLGIGTAVLAFMALPPPASPAIRRGRAQRRMVHAVRLAARRPAFLLPRPEDWCAPMFERLSLIAPDGAQAMESGQTLLLIGLLILALRATDDPAGRRVGRVVEDAIGGRPDFDALARIARPDTVEAMQTVQAARVAAIMALLRTMPADGRHGVWGSA